MEEKCAHAKEPSTVSPHHTREMFKVKLLYFFYLAACASLPAYLSVYFRQVGMSAVQTGILTGVQPFVTFISAPLWGIVADRTGKHKAVLIAAVVGSTLFLTGTYPFSFMNGTHGGIAPTNHTNVTGHPTMGPTSANGNTSMIPTFAAANGNHTTNISPTMVPPLVTKTSKHDTVTASSPTLLFSTLSHPTNLKLDTKTQGPEDDINSSLSSTAKFCLLLLLIVIAKFFMGSITPIMDATVVSTVGSDNFGTQRLWGAVGFGMGGLISGIAMNKGRVLAEASDQADFLPAFVLFLVLNTSVLMVSLTLKETGNGKPLMMVLPHLKLLFKSYQVLIFMAVVLIMGVSSGVITWFLFWFLKDIGGSQALLGISIAVTCASEVVVFLLAGKLLDKLGHSGVLYLSLLCFVIRLVSYSFLYNPWLVLPVELLHGFTFAAMWTACVTYGSMIAPPEVGTTIQGLLTGIHFGLGWGIGGALGGVVYEYFGPRVLFRACAVMCCFGMALQFLTQKLLGRRQPWELDYENVKYEVVRGNGQ